MSIQEARDRGLKVGVRVVYNHVLGFRADADNGKEGVIKKVEPTAFGPTFFVRFDDGVESGPILPVELTVLARLAALTDGEGSSDAD